MSHDDLVFIEAEELVERFEKKKTGELASIVDVREDDEIGDNGSVAGVVRAPTSLFPTSSLTKDVVRDNLDKKEIVVFCMKSQHRGPAAAREFIRALDELKSEGAVPDQAPEIKVLRGGFRGFHEKFGDSEYVAKL